MKAESRRRTTLSNKTRHGKTLLMHPVSMITGHIVFDPSVCVYACVREYVQHTLKLAITHALQDANLCSFMSVHVYVPCLKNFSNLPNKI